MLLTHRALLMLVLAAPVMAGSAWLPALKWAALAYLLVCAGLIYLDWRAAGSAGRFQVQRIHENRLSLGANNLIRVRVQNLRPRGTALWVRDEPPDEFRREPMERVMSGQAAARGSWEGSYMVLPLRRGDYHFGDVNLRWKGPLGLMLRQGKVAAQASVKVYPNLLDIRRYDLLLKRERLQEMGLRVIRHIGEGTEYDRLREYLPDDDYRHIDWKATARRSRPITVEYATERSQNILLVLDTGRMMQSPVGEIAKLDYAINAALLTAYVATGKGDRVGLMTFGSDVSAFMTPRNGRGQFYRMLEMLYRLEPEPVEPNYRRALTYLQIKQTKRALVVIFTDISGGPGIDTLMAHALMLNREHLLLVVTISDPDVKEAARVAPRNSAEVYRRAAAAQLLDERKLVLESLQRRGVMTLDIPANQLSMAVINQYLQMKAAMKL